MRLGERLSHRLRCATAIGRVAGRMRKLFVVVIVVHDVCMIFSVQGQGLSTLRGRTFTIDVWMLPEAVLHRLEQRDALDALGLLLREDEARKRGAEGRPARPVRHPAEARAVPVNLARRGVERPTGVGGVLVCGGVLGVFRV